MIFPVSQQMLGRLRRVYRLVGYRGKAGFRCEKCGLLFALTPHNLTPQQYEGLIDHGLTCQGRDAPGTTPARVRPFGST